MQFFEYPYVIISILAVVFVGLTVIGAYFAIRGLKTANGTDEKDFINIGRLESLFDKAGKRREERCMIYISAALEDFRSLYSNTQTKEVFSELRDILLNAFCDEQSAIAVYGENNFVVLANWTSVSLVLGWLIYLSDYLN